MEINVKFTADEFETLAAALEALNLVIEDSGADLRSIVSAKVKIRQLELRLHDALKGAIAKAMN